MITQQNKNCKGVSAPSKADQRLRDDHPLGARYQLGAVEIFASQPDRQFLLRSATFAHQFYAFAGEPLPEGYKAATLARYDGDAVQNAFGTLYCIELITFLVRLVDIPKLNAMSDGKLLRVWEYQAAAGWPIRRGPTVRGDEHLHALKKHWEACAEHCAGEDAIPIPEELARKQLLDEQFALVEQELDAEERREAEQRGASDGGAS